jgi:hemoglobin
VFAISAVVDHFSDALIKNLVVGINSNNPQLRDWSRNHLDRLPGLKFMRTLWVCEVTGGPFEYQGTKEGKHPLGLENAHRNLRISPQEFDAVAMELKTTLEHFKVPQKEMIEVLSAFAAHKNEVTKGFREFNGINS